MHNITFVIFTYNEEKRIERVIQNFKNYGKILLADNKSTDGTIEIAKAHGCQIYTREKHYVYVENQELVDAMFPHIDTEWVYWGFADEMLNDETLLHIQQVIAADKHSIINMNRRNYFYGSFCYDIYSGYTFKIFKKNAIDFRGNVIHGMGKAAVAESEIYKMPDKYFIHHFISNTASSYLNVINRYTDIEIEFDHQPKTSVIYFIWQVIKFVFKDYFMNRGYRAGYKGLTVIELTLFYAMVKNMKLYEKQQDLSNDTIEDKNNIYRDSILSGLKAGKI